MTTDDLLDQALADVERLTAENEELRDEIQALKRGKERLRDACFRTEIKLRELRFKLIERDTP